MYCDLPEFGRCCFCLPLRRGVMLFGFINITWCSFMVGLYSYYVHYTDNDRSYLVYHGVVTSSHGAICLTIYCLEFIVNCLLVYGAYQKILIYIKIHFYYTVMSSVAALVVEVVELSRMSELSSIMAIAFAGFCFQIYLILLVRSLIHKLEASGVRAINFHNPLQGLEIISDHPRVYNNTTEPPAYV